MNPDLRSTGISQHLAWAHPFDRIVSLCGDAWERLSGTFQPTLSAGRYGRLNLRREFVLCGYVLRGHNLAKGHGANLPGLAIYIYMYMCIYIYIFRSFLSI